MSQSEIHLLGASESIIAPVARSSMRSELLAVFRAHRLPETIAHDLAKTAEQSGLTDRVLALACALDRRMRTAPIDIGGCSTLMLVGPHGGGKTAVAAKLAAHARLACRPVKLIATDMTGAGANGRLAGFAAHLGVPIVVSEGADVLMKLIGSGAREGALLVIDTAGFDPRHDKLRSAFAALTKIEGATTVGVISACADAEEVVETIDALEKVGATRLVATGLDLVRRLGALAAAAIGSVPIAHLTCSPYVAAGLDAITPLSLAHAILDRDHAMPFEGSLR